MKAYAGETQEKAGAGKTYVLCAPPSVGKTTGAAYFLEHAMPMIDATGIMISGTARNYHEHMARMLECDPEDTTWAASLVAAMMPEVGSPAEASPPLLLLDEFNWPGYDNLNILFIDIFMRLVVDKKFICIILTQNYEVASMLCGLNDNQKIGPLPTAITKPWVLKEKVPWVSGEWEVSELIKLIRCRFPGKFGAEEDVAWIKKGMTPMDAIVGAS